LDMMEFARKGTPGVRTQGAGGKGGLKLNTALPYSAVLLLTCTFWANKPEQLNIATPIRNNFRVFMIVNFNLIVYQIKTFISYGI